MQIPKEYSDFIISCWITWFLGFVQRLAEKKKHCMFEHVIMDKVQKTCNPKS